MTLLQTFQMVTLRPGWVELPADYAEGLLSKGAGHKYIKRVPKAGGGYRYFYHVAHGGGVHAQDHFVEGAAFRHDGGHYHITKVDGDKLTIKHDENGKTSTVTKQQLSEGLQAHHSESIKAHHEKTKKDIEIAKKSGASEKQIAKLEKRAKASAPAKSASSSDKHSGYKTKVTQSGPNKWDVEITTPDGDVKHERVGGMREIADAKEARDVALEQFIGSGGSGPKKAADSEKATPDRVNRSLKEEFDRQHEHYKTVFTNPKFAHDSAKESASELVRARKNPAFHAKVARIYHEMRQGKYEKPKSHKEAMLHAEHAALE